MPGSIATTPSTISKNATSVLSLVGTGTNWTGGTTFSFQSDASGSTVSSFTVTDANHATVTIAAGATAAPFVLWDNGAVRSNSVSVAEYGQVDALALAVVEWLATGQFYTMDNKTPRAFCLPIAAEARFKLIDNLNASQSPAVPSYDDPVSVDVFPDIETSQRQALSTAFVSQYGIHIFIQQQLTGAADEEAQCRLLTALRSQIIEGIKQRAFDLDSAVHPVKGVILIEPQNVDRGFRGKGLYSIDRLLQQHVYESDTILIFRAAA